MQRMAAVKDEETGMGVAPCHLLHLFQRGDATFAAAKNKRAAVGSKPVRPVVTDKVLLICVCGADDTR
jgi:hypothetical protein